MRAPRPRRPRAALDVMLADAAMRAARRAAVQPAARLRAAARSPRARGA